LIWTDLVDFPCPAIMYHFLTQMTFVNLSIQFVNLCQKRSELGQGNTSNR
jgi:hypothetical protein